MKGSEISKNLTDSMSKTYGIEMVGTEIPMLGTVGHSAVSTQIPRNRENSRCHLCTGHHGRKMERISQKKIFHETGKWLHRLVKPLSEMNNSKIGGIRNNERKK